MRYGARIHIAALAIVLLACAASAAVAQGEAAEVEAETPAEAEISSADPGDGDAATAAVRRGARHDPRQEPADGGAYFYRQMVLALVVMAGTIAVLAWLVRRHSRRR